MSEDTESRYVHPALGLLVGHLFWRARLRVNEVLSSTLPEDVDIHAYGALLTLLSLPSGTSRSQQALADVIGVSRTTMATAAAALQRQGLVERRRNPDDRRSYSLSPTPVGEATAREWRAHADEVEKAICAGLRAPERAELRGLLDRVAAAALSPELPADLRGSTGFLVAATHARMHREFDQALAPTGLEAPQFAALVALRSSGPLSQIQLARAVGASGAHMVQIVDQLEAKGLVERRGDPGDRRTRLVHPLGPAKAVTAAAERAARRTSERFLAPLREGQRGRLLELMRALVTAA